MCCHLNVHATVGEAVIAPLMVHLHLGSLHVVLQLHLWLSNPAELKA